MLSCWSTTGSLWNWELHSLYLHPEHRKGPGLLSHHHHTHIHRVTTLQQFGFKMSLRIKSHTDLQIAGMSSLEGNLYKSLSVSSSNISRGTRFGNGTAVEGKGLSRTLRRPVRAVRPISTNSGGSFPQIHHLQGELVRKRKVRRWRRWIEILFW